MLAEKRIDRGELAAPNSLEVASRESDQLSAFSYNLRKEFIYDDSIPAHEVQLRDWADEPGRSRHVDLYVGTTPVASYRMTEVLESGTSIESILSDWTLGQYPLPRGAEVVEATRCVVAPEWRGCGLFEVAVHDMLARANQLREKRFVACLVQDRFVGIQNLFEQIGFSPVVTSSPLYCAEFPGRLLKMRPYLFHLADEKPITSEMQERKLAVPPV